MWSIIFKFLGPVAPYLAVAGAMVGLLLYVSVLRQELGSALQANASLQATNQADTVALAVNEKQQQLTNRALDTLDSATRDTQTGADRVLTQIASVQAQDNGPVAPVLTKALNSIRALQANSP
jgi:hypothetical protein